MIATDTTSRKGDDTMTDAALATLTTLADETRAAEQAARDRKAARDQALVEAQRAGATYPQMARAASLTRDRVAQVLAARRQQ